MNSNGQTHNRNIDKNTLLERLSRLKRQFEWDDISEEEYIAKRDEIKRELAQCEPPVARALIDAARYLQNMATVWEVASLAERRDMVRVIFEEVWCDTDGRCIASLRPKPIFIFLFRHIPGLIERNGTFDIQSGEG